jgi:hypothetical protein
MGFWVEEGAFRSAGMSKRFQQRAFDVVAPHLQRAQKLGQVRQDLAVEELADWLLDNCIMLLLLKGDYELADIRRHLSIFALPAIRPPS